MSFNILLKQIPRRMGTFICFVLLLITLYTENSPVFQKQRAVELDNGLKIRITNFTTSIHILHEKNQNYRTFPPGLRRLYI